MIRLARPAFEPDEIASVVAVLESGNLVQGDRVAAFEQAVASYLGAPHAVACASGTAALHLAVLALELAPGEEVIVPTYTFPATANVIELAGARPRVVDIDPLTFNLDVGQVEAAIGPRTRAIIPVHLFGLAADMAALLPIARRHGLRVVEDAACALGARHPMPGGDAAAGTTGAMACWSFHPRKVITTAEGGMVTTHDDDLALRLRALRNHGAAVEDGRVVYPRPGLNYRLTDLQGALGVGQMARLEGFIARRQALAALYDEGLAGIPGISPPAAPAGFRHVYQAYVTLLDDAVDRPALMARLKARGIESSIGTYALHEQPGAAARYDLDPAAFLGGSRASRASLALPLHPGLTEGDIHRVVEALAEELRR